MHAEITKNSLSTYATRVTIIAGFAHNLVSVDAELIQSLFGAHS